MPSVVTIDLLFTVLNKTFFHPFIAWLLPLCLRAVQAPYSSTQLRSAIAYAIFITVCWLFRALDQRIAYGVPREVNWDEEVVVITGGASGLGKVLSQMYAMRGASIAVLDVKKAESEVEGVEWYQCDAGDASAVEKVKEKIEKDLGTPTILINNAGLLNGRPLWSLTSAEISRNFNVNLVAHFNTLRTFLPGMFASSNGGTIVTIASVLGKVPASYLSDYCAAKAGLIAMHTSLRSDLASLSAPKGAKNIRTVLVTPGQLSTALFAGVQTPSNFLGPVVEPVELAREIVRVVDEGVSAEISLPLYAQWIEWLGVLPAGVKRIVRALTGVDRAMETARRK